MSTVAADSPEISDPTSLEPGARGRPPLTPELGGGADSAPDGPPPSGPPKGYGPPPPSILAVESWYIGPGDVTGTNTNLSMGFLSVSSGKRFTFGRTMLSLRPQFQTLFLGESGLGLPDQIYGLTMDVQVEQPLSRRLSLQVAATPGLYTDWRNLSGEAFRVPARMFASYRFGPELVVIGGVVYTAQPDLPIIPAAGAIWSPNDRWRYELIAPRPRVVYRWSEAWQSYGLFSFESSTYAIETAGRNDLFQYRDFRVALGLEYTTKQKARWFAVVGSAFGRRLDLGLGEDRNLEPGLFLRGGVRF
ncbi:MAG: DUF6268 family outer membrane beta-barrel protein [Isosphaeraceae bacterium]|nr:DUF6268 family outer membrane beta-barrel protein [Isosphaeraceae bacterium]